MLIVVGQGLTPDLQVIETIMVGHWTCSTRFTSHFSAQSSGQRPKKESKSLAKYRDLGVHMTSKCTVLCGSTARAGLRAHE